MKKQRYYISSYLRENQEYVFVRKNIPSDPPSVIHDHDYYECFWLEQGEVLHLINTQTQKTESREIIFIRPSDTHAFQSVGQEACRMINITIPDKVIEHFRERYGAELKKRFFWSENKFPSRYGLSERQWKGLSGIANQLEFSGNSLIHIETFLLNLFTRILNESLTEEGREPNWLREVCGIVKNPEIFRQGAAGLVKISGYTHEYVCRTMKKHLGVSPTDYVNQIRMEYIAHLLSNSDEDLLQIVFECGFKNLGYFYQLFRKHYGMTPVAYRKKYKTNLI